MNNYNDFPITSVTKEELYTVLPEKQKEGYRLTQICATAYEGYNEVTYSVSKGYDMENYKVVLPIEEEIKSFSDIFPAATLYENEIKELWGVNVVGMLIDYKNNFYRISKETPFKKQVKAAKEGEANE